MKSRNARSLVVITVVSGWLAGGLSGCTTFAVGAGATGATAAAQERGLMGAVDDTVIRARINALWLDHDEEMYRKVTLAISEGRVRLRDCHPGNRHLLPQPTRTHFVAGAVCAHHGQGVPV